MTAKKHFDVIILGGSYSGLAAGMALGRALRQVLIIGSGNPCNRQTPHSHNFITQEGKTPNENSTLTKEGYSEPAQPWQLKPHSVNHFAQLR